LRLAGAHGLAVQMHGARTAQSRAAAEFRSGEFQVLAHYPKQRRIGISVDANRLAVDRKRDHRHAFFSMAFSFLHAEFFRRLLLAPAARHVRVEACASGFSRCRICKIAALRRILPDRNY
jgi:hypothetical protein